MTVPPELSNVLLGAALAGIGWVLKTVQSIDRRLTVMETRCKFHKDKDEQE